MEAAKTFERNGKRYHPGDPMPDDLDAVTRAHYLRYGMIRARGTPAPTEHKPAGPTRAPRQPKPRQAETPTPMQTAQTAQTAQPALAESQDASGLDAGSLRQMAGESGGPESEASGQTAAPSFDPGNDSANSSAEG